MKSEKSEIKIGATVLLAIFILVAGILWGKQISLTAGMSEVKVRFTDIAGLETGASVLVNGIRKGKVDLMELEQDGVIVHLSLGTDVILYTDARFEVTSPELMGGKVINIFPGISGIDPTDGHIFAGDSGGGMNELMKRSGELVEDVKGLLAALEATIKNINETAGDPRLREALVSSVNNFDESSQRTLEIINMNEDKLTHVMDNLVSATDYMRGFLETHAGEIDTAVTHFEELTATLNHTAEQLNAVVHHLQSSDNTAGMLLNDEEFALSLRRTLENLDSLVVHLRENGIQTNISLFGRKK